MELSRDRANPLGRARLGTQDARSQTDKQRSSHGVLLQETS